jgi:hypothetical protein
MYLAVIQDDEWTEEFQCHNNVLIFNVSCMERSMLPTV